MRRPFAYDGWTELFFTEPERNPDGQVRFAFGVRVTLPELSPGGPSDIATLFSEFVRRLEEHEGRHVELYRRAFPEMRAIPGPSAADALAQLVEIAERYDSLSREYDRVTINGLTEGVTWPPP